MANIPIGVLVPLVDQPKDELGKVVEMGLDCCQVVSWKPEMWTDELGESLMQASADTGVKITAFWSGYTGPRVWNFTEGPVTVGLVPDEYRDQRVTELKQAADWAAKLGLGAIVTHVGFLPEDPSDGLYKRTVEGLKQVAGHAADKGVEFWYETGQETPVNLLRTIENVGTGNQGVNLDAANLILYGKANPVDALGTFGKYVRGVHAKDGLYPTDGTNLGKEVPLGEGKVNFPALVAGLRKYGYAGSLTIEREISGPQQIADIKRAVEILRPLCND
jgi:sugar phosphate isomerase/epimerase